MSLFVDVVMLISILMGGLARLGSGESGHVRVRIWPRSSSGSSKSTLGLEMVRGEVRRLLVLDHFCYGGVLLALFRLN